MALMERKPPIIIPNGETQKLRVSMAWCSIGINHKYLSHFFTIKTIVEFKNIAD